MHQINNVLARNANLPAEAGDRAKREILERLIDQELAMQQAVHKKLDRSPGVQQSLAAARTEILARAYVEQIAAAQPKPTSEEIGKYYSAHPELFAQRRVYSLEEIVLVANEDIGPELRQRASRSRSLKETADWLQSRGAKFTPSRGVRAAEQIPLELLSQLHGVKDGETLVTRTGGTWQVIRVVASKLEPVDEQTATPRIQQFLSNRRAHEAVANDMKQLKAGAKIQYLGEFADGPSGAEARAKAEAKARSRAEAETKAKADAEAQTRAEETTKARMAAEAQARLEAEAKARAEQSQPVGLGQDAIKKGIGGLN